MAATDVLSIAKDVVSFTLMESAQTPWATDISMGPNVLIGTSAASVTYGSLAADPTSATRIRTGSYTLPNALGRESSGKL